MNWMDGGDWDSVEQTNNGATSPPSSLLLSMRDVGTILDKVLQRQAQMENQSDSHHVNIWNEEAPHRAFNHDKF